MVNLNANVQYDTYFEIYEYLCVSENKIILPGFGTNWKLFSGKSEKHKTILPDSTVLIHKETRSQEQKRLRISK